MTDKLVEVKPTIVIHIKVSSKRISVESGIRAFLMLGFDIDIRVHGVALRFSVRKPRRFGTTDTGIMNTSAAFAKGAVRNKVGENRQVLRQTGINIQGTYQDPVVTQVKHGLVR